MRLSAWRAAAPHRVAASAGIAAVVDPILLAFGAGPDPHCWVAWGDEPTMRFTILIPTDPGLITCFVRVNVSGEGPRATTKLVRWGRVAIGELAVETQGGHRLLSFQVEGQVLRGIDQEADQVAAFALRVIAAIDGRPLPPVEETPRRRSGTTARGSRATGPGTGPSARGSSRAASGQGSKPSKPSKPSTTARSSVGSRSRPG
jgi:hypothetical protein